MKKKNSIEAFSLIEMIVSIGILMILSGTLIAYNSAGNKKTILYGDQAKVIGVLNQTKSLALQKYHEGRGSSDAPCGYGVRFSTAGYSIMRIDSTRVNSIRNCDNITTKPTVLINQFSLSPNVSISEFPSGDVIFEAPYLNVHNFGLVKLTLGSMSLGVEISQGGGISPNYNP